ncbi:MAG: GNAT family N-acetyltransferase, partial [Myxococcota bacterium]
MEIRSLRAPELEQAWELDRDAFHVKPAGREGFVRLDPARAIGTFEGERLIALCFTHPLAQHFGGRAVPMGGLASVAVVPDRRGEGLATRVCRESLHAMRARGEVISTLYPASTGLYRKLGWEVAGFYVWHKLAPGALHALPAPERKAVRPASLAVLANLRACYDRVAPSMPGSLARDDAWWDRLAGFWQPHSRYVATDERGEVEGYVIYEQLDGEYSVLGGPRRLFVREIVAATRDAALALWRLLGTWSSQVSALYLIGPVDDGLLLLAPEQELQVLAQTRWMTRVVDAAAAVAMRGYAEGVEIEVPLALDDPVLPENEGSYVLRISKGQGELARSSRAGADAPQLAIGGFASLYTGFA